MARICILTSLSFRRRTPSFSIASSNRPSTTEDAQHITILRPIKGIEPHLYECLASVFNLDYPPESLSIYLCVSSSGDSALPLLKRLLANFPGFDVKIFVEEVDPHRNMNLGPNPKIRNMSRPYREAKSDIIWIMDSNVWIGKGAARRMVSTLCGYGEHRTKTKPYKLVHQLPLVIDCARNEDPGLGNETSIYENETKFAKALRVGGGRLEEMWMATSHAKFYSAINEIHIAPCIVGKSNMFRRSHLQYLTSRHSSDSPGIDFFSNNICEDQLIGHMLWWNQVPEEKAGELWGKHALIAGDMAIQPVAMSVSEYVARRVRWLRVRKWTTTVATLIEPGVESLLCSAYGSFAITTLPWFHNTFGIPHTWAAFIIFWGASVFVWMVADWFVYVKLHSRGFVEVDSNTPSFALPPLGSLRRRLHEWVFAWMGRELLALPIWVMALWGSTIIWRSKTFRIGMDMKVHEVETDGTRKACRSQRKGSVRTN
jgi:ceramide glucosyltransferase